MARIPFPLPRAHLVSLAVLLAASLAGCTSHRSILDDSDGGQDAGQDGGQDAGQDGGQDAGNTLVSIRIAGLGTGPLQVGASVSLQVLALDTQGNQSDVTADSTITSSNPGVASISGSTLTAVARGTTIIQASLPVSGGNPLQAAASVTVQDANSGTTVAVQVTPATLSLAPGLGAQLAANATQGDGSQLSVTALAQWSTSSQSLCTVDNTNQKGFVTAVAFGTCTVTATYGGQSGAATISVTQLTATALVVAPAAATLAAGATAQLTASATLSDGSVADATHSAVWSTSASSVATVTAGLVTGAGRGSATVTATLGALTATAAITVTAATLSSISVAPSQANVAAGLTQQFTATAVYSDGTTSNATALVSWQSSAPAVATLDPSAPGLIDALTPGSANITATLSGVTGSATITVSSAAPTQITLSPSPITLPAGVSQQVTATARFTDNSVRDVSSNVTWTVGNPAFATVSASGLLTGLAQGSTTLTASLGGVTATDALTITAAQLAQILLQPQNASVAIAGTQQFSATGIYGDNSLHDVTEQATWSTSSAATATVSNAAGTRGFATGVAAGTAQITATVGAVSSSPASLTVSGATLVSINLRITPPLTAVYITVPSAVTARYSDGSQVDVTAQAVYTSADATVASVIASGTGAGQVTGVGQGQTNITAAFGGQTSSQQITVVAATLQSIDVQPPRGMIEVGQSVQLRANAQFMGAPVPIDVTTLVTWTSADTTIGVFDATPNGQFTAVGAGMVTVAAELDGISGTRSLTVAPATPVSIAIVPASVSIPVGVTQALVAIGTYPDGSTQDITTSATWASSANAVAVVGDSGTLKGFVTSVSPGSANVTATLDSVTGTAPITVTGATAKSILVTPVTYTATGSNGGGGPGGGGGGGGGFRQTTVPYYATATFSDNSNVDVTQSCVWTSSDPSVATISNQAGTKGVATVVAVGAATITATFRGLTGTGALTSR